MKSSLHILICDVNIDKRGHYIGYNQYILDNFHKLENENPHINISFLFNAKAKEFLSFNNQTAERVSFLEDSLSPARGMYSRHRILIKIKAFTKLHQVDHLIIMEFDKYQFSFFLTKFNCKVSGILFRPHHRVKITNAGIKKMIWSRMTFLKKQFADKLLSKNSAIQNVFILNDEDGVELLNKIHKSAQFKYLPDPIYIYNTNPALSSLNTFDKSAYKFLVFGWLDERKNITLLLKAYDAADFDFKTELILVGPVREEYLEYLCSLISGLNSIDNKHKSIFIRGEFVTNEEMDYYFSIIDVCLLVYKDFFGSSGILGRAALHQKKVIAANMGVIEQLVNTYQLGITCDPYDTGSIAEALSSIHLYKTDPDLSTLFNKQHSPEAFLSTLLNVEGITV